MTYHVKLLNNIARALIVLFFISFFLPLIAYSQAEDVNALIQRLKDEDPVVREQVATILKEITGENFSEDHIKWQEWWEKNKE